MNMKNIKYLLLILVSVLTYSCQERDIDTYSGEDYVQFVNNKDLVCDFVYLDPAVQRDTVYVEVQLMGNYSRAERTIKLVQATNDTDEFFQAEVNKHFVALDNELTSSFLTVSGDQTTARVPIILLRDKSLKENRHELTLKLASADDFFEGDNALNKIKIIIGDKLNEPSNWNVDYYGDYSVVKHQFFIENTSEKWDNVCLAKINADKGMRFYYINKLRLRLQEFNEDPENIALGIAPLREIEGDLTSALIVIPEQEEEH